MDDTRTWDERRNVIRTKKGGLILGKDVVSHGHSLLEDFVGKKLWTEVIILHATGRMPSRQFGTWLDAAFICMSYPDARIWCNTAGSYAGTLRVPPIGAIAAGMLTSDSVMYGVGTVHEYAHAELVALFASHQSGTPTQTLLDEALEAKRMAGKRPTIAGFARPLMNGDERITFLRAVAEREGFVPGPFERFVYDLHEACMRTNGEAINLAAYAIAFMSDQGFTLTEFMRIYSPCIIAGIIACHAEAFDNPPEAFLPLRCDDIAYEGRAPRPVPRKR